MAGFTGLARSSIGIGKKVAGVARRMTAKAGGATVDAAQAVAGVTTPKPVGGVVGGVASALLPFGKRKRKPRMVGGAAAGLPAGVQTMSSKVGPASVVGG